MSTLVSIDQRLRIAPSYVRFGLVGIIATIVDFGLFNLGLLGEYEPTTAHLLIAASSGFMVATYTSYQLNARFTFRAPRDNRALTRYFAIALAGVLIHNTALLALRSLLSPDTFVALNMTKAGALSVSMLWNYVGYRQFAFQRP
ncbi:MAG: GtrA family protein [Chloroflexi bacterium]|nr:GtrA family protein [Chloroflexota bacterium]MDA1147983.1 GtrA family protein [Chloroflexota bacterium]MQC82560.1 GtrA family protein [Chloroflexota bacterium]